MTDQVFTILKIAVQALYNAVPAGSPDGLKHWEWFQKVSPGDLVMEQSTLWHNHTDATRFGYLISVGQEPAYSEEMWEEIKDQWNGEPCPTERVYRIRLLKDGSEMRWTNASFMRVPQDMAIATDFHIVTKTGKPFDRGQ